MKLHTYRSLLAALLACLWTSLSEAKDVSNTINLGQDIANKHCARCHVVNTHNVLGGISSTPSFPFLVNHLEDWEERFASFHTRLPHPSIIRFKGEKIDHNKAILTVPVELIYSDIDALVAYARSLKKSD